MVQEDINQRSVALVIRGAKITARALAKAMALALREMKKARDAPGRKTVRQLAKGGDLEKIEITDGNIKAFEPIARKYGVRYALRRDASSDPPRWMVFFRAKQADQLTGAFSEFTAKTLRRETEKPSMRERMAQLREIIRNTARDRTRSKERSGPEL
jgi:hypothetical protein